MITYRYPGVQPFSTQDKDLFFGRENEIRELSELIQLEKLVVLYGQSGIGKSSLLQAGIAPKLIKESNFMPIWVRIGSYVPSTDDSTPYLTPRESFRLRISLENQQITFLHKISESEESLWFHAKNRSLTNSETSGFLIIIDQFEELFTWPEEDISDFKLELAELLNLEMSDTFRQALQLKLKENRNVLSHQELDELYNNLTVKVVFGIRSDRLSLLNRISDVLPDVLRNCYELHPMTIEQGQLAITQPALLSGDFQSPIFTYSPKAIDAFLAYLSKGHQQKIEPFQLQILCQYVENYVEFSKDDYIELSDVGKLDEIYHNYYEGQIQSLGGPIIQEKASRLLEEGLIFEQEERRLSLFEGVIIQDYGLTKDQLQKLTRTRLLRTELDSKGGGFYEISHDALVGPILQAKKERIERETKIIADQEQKRQQQEREENLKKAWGKRIIAGGITLAGIALIAGFIAIFQNITLRNTLSNISSWSTTQIYFAHEMIESLQFGRAELLLNQAAELDPKNEEIKNAYLEIIYYFLEAGQINDVLHLDSNPVFQLAPKEIEPGIDTVSYLKEKLALLIEEDRLSDLQKKYYPEMVLVKGGEFQMGSMDSLLHEQPVHKVEVNDFEIGTTEVTVYQYGLFCLSSGRQMPAEPGWGMKGNNPIVLISWQDAVDYTKWLSEKTGKTYRLPKEAEWEYAARGGEMESNNTLMYSGSNIADSVAWYTINPEPYPGRNPNQTNPVGQKQANALGIYDMSGNVWEWCSDWYDATYYQYCVDKQIVLNPSGPDLGDSKVVRGGSWGAGPHFLRVSDRVRTVPDRKLDLLGFRVAADH